MLKINRIMRKTLNTELFSSFGVISKDAHSKDS